jgi:glutamate dehydrogenase (NAD(P)+)
VHVHHLQTVDGWIVHDLDPEAAPVAAGGTRLADDVDVDELALLARAMTYKLATFEARIGGAKAGVRPRLLDTHRETLARYRDEIRPLVEQRRFLTGADLGTSSADFAELDDGAPSIFDHVIDGVGFEELVTGRGVVAAAEAWLGSLEGRTVAVEGFGKVGHGVAREVVRRGGRVVAVSTLRGAVARAGGFDVDELVAARAEHGESFVHHLGLEVHLPRELHELRVDVLVPGARVGVLDADLARRVQASVVAPAANVPYTSGGLDALRAARVAALPDFVCNGGAVLAHRASPALTPEEVLRAVDREVGGRIEAAKLAKVDPFRHATLLADTFLSTWLAPEHRPDGPALAP